MAHLRSEYLNLEYLVSSYEIMQIKTYNPQIINSCFNEGLHFN